MSRFHAFPMSDLRALLLTDVVDSTKLSTQVGDAEMARLWAAHDRAARDLLPVWHGREIDKTDGMLLLFDAAVRRGGLCAGVSEGTEPTRSRRSRRAQACMSAPSRCARTARRCRAGRQADRSRGRGQGDCRARDVGGHGRADPAVSRCTAIAERRRLSVAVAWTLAGQGLGRADRVVRDRRRPRGVHSTSRCRQGLPGRPAG